MYPWPDEAPKPWNTVLLTAPSGESFALPGIATLSIALDNAIDVKKATGTSGATVTFQGQEPATITVELFMFQASQLEAWKEAVALLRPRVKPATKFNYFNIVHPQAMLYKIVAVVLKSIKDGPKNKGDEYRVTLEFVEWRAPDKGKPATVKPKGLEARTQVLAEDLPSKNVGP